ncbi:hypothetical protein QOZ80_2BG0164260 [Eleusine coracana subsp. coracana]|nr:hypothetical protein QOZ80_2BG0164260 [Eleusine coracana subsp. coracana]
MFYAGGDDDDIGRYLAHIPLPEPHHLPMTTIADDLDLLATQFVDDSQHAPADPALQAPLMTPNAATTTGFVHEPAAMDVVGGYQEAALLSISVEDYQYQAPTTMAIVQQPEMVVPSAADEHAYAFPEPPPLGAAAIGMDDGALPPSFQDTFHGGPAGNPSLYDGNDELAALFDGIDVGDATGTGYATTMEVEPDYVRPVEDDSTMFVPFVPGQLDCTKCHTVRELVHESANHKLHLILHGGADHGTFHHLITYRVNIGADGQTTTNEHMYLNLHQHTDSWVQSFIAKCVETLGNDNSGQLIDSWSTLGAAACSDNNSTFPVVKNDAHAALELDMLKKILSTSLTNDEAPSPNGPLQEITPQELENSQEGQTLNIPDWHELNLPKLDSSNISVVQDGGPGSPAQCLSQLGEQRKRISNMTMADTLNLLHMSREDAAKHLKISSSSLKRLWNKNGTHR